MLVVRSVREPRREEEPVRFEPVEWPPRRRERTPEPRREPAREPAPSRRKREKVPA